MARTRKPRPSFEVPATPAAGAGVAPGWVYRTDADAPALPAPAKPADPSPPTSLVSELANVVLLPVRIGLLPVAIGLVAVLVPLSFLTPRWRR